MRRAIISDIHGNLHALEAVLGDIGREAVEDVVCLGDVVGYGAFPAECLALVRQHCSLVVCGNHDHAVGHDYLLEAYYDEARQSLEWTREALDDGERAYLAGLPLEHRTDWVTYVHASLPNPETWGYLEFSGDVVEHLKHQETPVCFIGHTHLPGVYSGDLTNFFEISWNARQRLPEGPLVVNVGSVGQPRDQDPRACYVIYDEMQGVISYRRVRYPIAEAQQAIREAGLAPFFADRLRVGI